ncbi:protein boule-like isoform X2 [Limulus polyphemus]|uniref:Protein boule-like isoform X2 n=1 Tax=Limulus polyphemus TaxID=6850 RepID=A0ABM1S8H1_LIMPO|nr:protein boule-like isoform X2 [Limulus polyphemus]
MLRSSDPSSDGPPSPSPISGLNAPKFGTLIPNRIFVGGISPSTTEAELHALFSNYGNVKATKIIADRAGVSKGYGFVTFETEEEAKRMQAESENLVLKDRKLNIAPAIKKQPFGRMYNESTQLVPNGTIIYQNGVPCTYHNGMAFYSAPDSLYQVPQPQTTYPVVYGQPMYVPQQQFQYQPAMSAQWTANNQWHWAAATSSVSGQHLYSTVSSPPTITTQTSSELYHYELIPHQIHLPANPSGVQLATYPTHTTTENFDYTVLENECEGYKPSYPKTTPSIIENYAVGLERHNIPTSATRCHSSGENTSSQKHLVPKMVNGVTVMAYHNPCNCCYSLTL